MKKTNPSFFHQCRLPFPGLLMLVLLFPGYPLPCLQAQPVPEKGESIFDLLGKNGKAVQLALRTDMDKLINNRAREDDYQPAKLTYPDAGGNVAQLELDVIPRGNYRRRICDFPPILFNFSKDGLEKMGLDRRYDKMKLVTYCKEEPEAEGHLLKEYLAYRIYNLISPKSYRVQLARITYQDSEGKHENMEQYGILIEDTDEMARRIGGLECECWNYPPDSISLADENRMSVFQFMIGNEDWSTQTLRNVKMIRLDGGGKVVPVPYDFDFSGFVETPYAVPNSQLGITAITQRKFLGFKARQELLSETVKAFDLKREEIQSLIKGFDILVNAERKKAARYIDSFYKKKVQEKLAEEALAPAPGSAGDEEGAAKN
ncbi:MAG: hypothetical protein J5I98_05240 [Phaeodactylibacter sp.]|nr:hypothetical protein [Phaeodactylibacter sp.]